MLTILDYNHVGKGSIIGDDKYDFINYEYMVTCMLRNCTYNTLTTILHEL